MIDDHCQYWLNNADGTLTSPNFGVNDLGGNQYYRSYDNNLNCTWILHADEGYYITLDFGYSKVNHIDTNDIYFCNFFNKVHHSSYMELITWYMVTISQSMMDQISNLH